MARLRSGAVEPEAKTETKSAASTTTTVGRGWGSYNKAKEASAKAFGESIKWTDDEEVIIKFLEDSPFASYQEHWIKEITETGERRSFVCLGDDCPLCAHGHVADRFQALFNTVVLDENGKGTVKIWKAAAGAAGEIEKRALAKTTSPLDRDDLYFSVVRTKEKNSFYKYKVDPVKARDLVDDYEMTPLTEAELDALAEKMYDEDEVKLDSVKDLQDIAKKYLD